MGFRVVEELARRGGVSLGGEECGSLVALVSDPGGPRLAVKEGEAGQAGAAGLAGSPGEAARAATAGNPAGEPGEAVAASGTGPADRTGYPRQVAEVSAATPADTAGEPGETAEAIAGSGPSGPDIREPASVLLVQPQTYMNRSGYAARCFAERHGLAPADFLVVYDEINLPLGRLRLRRGGSPAGHRGMESILENLRTEEVPRLRLGVAPEGGPPPGTDLVDFVLAPFEAAERDAVEAMIARAADACEAWLKQGVEAAMNQFNR